MNDDITLIVLAAGAGKRFWPITTNKALFPFLGLPMLAHVLADVPEVVTRMIIVTNPANDSAIRSFRFPIETSTVIQKEANGMADAMLACREVVGNSSILVVSADDLVDSSLIAQVILTAKKSASFGAIPGRKTLIHGPFGYLSLSGDRVTGIFEKPELGQEPSQYIELVCHYIEDGNKFFDILVKTKSTKDNVYEKALTSLMALHTFTYVPYEGDFAPLKYPWHVLDVLHLLLGEVEKHIGKNVEIKKNVIIEGSVYIEDNVKIFENTKIVGPCYIGKNVIIGNNSIIRESHIGADSVIGFNCDITRSYLGDNCWLHMNYVGDSVLEGNISMGGGVCLANLRLDDGEISSVVDGKKVPTGRSKLGAIIGKGVRIGVNASVMPGVKIGRNSFIGSGVILDKDAPDDSFCVAKSGYTVTKNLKNAPVSRDAFKKKI